MLRICYLCYEVIIEFIYYNFDNVNLYRENEGLL